MEKIPVPAAMLKSSYPGPITFYNGVGLRSSELLLLARRDVEVPGLYRDFGGGATPPDF